MDKVKLPKSVFDQFEFEKAKGNWWKERIAKRFLKFQLQDCSLSFDVVMTALLHGYDVEETPEDKVREYYNSGKRGVFNEEWDADGYQRSLGVVETLRLLNIKIEGIN
jgi:hypothetical protein